MDNERPKDAMAAAGEHARMEKSVTPTKNTRLVGNVEIEDNLLNKSDADTPEEKLRMFTNCSDDEDAVIRSNVASEFPFTSGESGKYSQKINKTNTIDVVDPLWNGNLLQKPPVTLSTKPPRTGSLKSVAVSTSVPERNAAVQAMHKLSTAKVIRAAAPIPGVTFNLPLDDDSTRIVAIATATSTADTRRSITRLMDSRDVNVAVVDVDVHNNVDDCNNNSINNNNNNNDKNKNSEETDDYVASRGNSNSKSSKHNMHDNSNKLVVDNAKSLDYNHSTTTSAANAAEEEAEGQAVVASEPAKQTMKIPTIAATESASTALNGNGNHKASNYEIHQPYGHMLRPLPDTSCSQDVAAMNGRCHRTCRNDGGARCELASPRCQSRESNNSGLVGEGRCPSNDSVCSGNESVTPVTTPTRTSPPVGLPLPATLAPAAAAALLPPQSAAVAAYLNAAAAAAQQNHLLLTNPLAAAASLVQQATQSPTGTRLTSSSSPTDIADTSVLDFSTKRVRCESGLSDEEGADEERTDFDVDNGNDDITAEDANSPLDLSLSAGRKRQSAEEQPIVPTRKIARVTDYKPLPPGTWVPPINPYLAAVAAASLSPKTSSFDWNGKQKISPNEATKALQKMTEMTRLGSATETEVPMRQVASSSNSNNASGRHSAWQSHWLNKGADAVKDVFKCVWCKQSFPTLASLTIHMKETQHCGVNVPPTIAAGAVSMPNSSSANHTAQSSHHSRHSSAHNAANHPSSTTTSQSSSKSDLNLLIKETMPLPRKLVRGQDVWLGKGAEQTRQILKCMWCGQSFRSLAEMTSHMQETQHYTNIISQEQIISWKSSDDKSSSGGSSNGAATSPAVTSPSAPSSGASTAVNAPASNATVSAVLTCKVCDQAFSSLKDLSNHMVKNSHYKEHMMRPANDNNTNASKRGRQAREKRKKSLPVRKLLELERAQQDFKSNSLDPALKPLRDFTASTKITCEKCGDKIETALFVDHIRQCLGGNIPMSPRHNNLKSPYTHMGGDRLISPQTPGGHSNGRKTAEDIVAPMSTRPDILYPLPKEGEKSNSSPSVLNAIEQLIEKSFDTRSRSSNSFGGGGKANTPLGSNILKRLGIDDSVDYTKPLMDAQTMHFLRSYSNYSGRDRSASESSSISERCNSRLESITPERNSELSRHTTPRLSPDKISSIMDAVNFRKDAYEAIKIKSEPVDNAEMQLAENRAHEVSQKISVKKEFTMSESSEGTLHKSVAQENEMKRGCFTPGSGAISPTNSERSITPRSTSSIGEKKILPGGSSLNALSSMFDNLSNMNSCLTSNASAISGETNNNNTTGKKRNANPLAALQKLCDTTDPPASNTRSGASHLPLVGAHSVATNGGTGSMVAFSWACNDAVMTSSDSIIKCSFCDTPFCSKGAYRHHLSKVHFVKDEADSQSPHPMKSPGLAPSPKSVASPKNASKSPAAQQQVASPSIVHTPTINPYDESPQSKFLKYTELAKQLSSKNV